MKKFVFTDYSALENSEETIAEIANLIKQGCVGAIPTDTVYGFVCLAKNSSAAERIINLKGRESDKPFLILANDWKTIAELVDLTTLNKVAFNDYWPGNNTLIMQSKQSIPFVSNFGTVAIRWPANNFLDKLINKIGEPLISTSLNQSGEELIKDSLLAENIFPTLNFLVSVGELIVSPSSIYDLTDFSNIRKVR
ncbi:MAG: L-threonylcarbamoyladenylate synthase [Patescibacteria group bacterium]|nr:L-threonylcarbamoyladenylate synthase [Patescibacteria group bacterium]